MAKSRPIKSADVPAYSSPSNSEKRKEKKTPSMADLHGTDVGKTARQLSGQRNREHWFRSRLCAMDTMNISSVKLISTLLAEPRGPTTAGWSDGVTYEEGQDRGVRRAAGGQNNAGKRRETKGRGDGG